MDIVSVFDEATRDHEAEQHTAAMAVAVNEATAVWPFLALAQSQEEYENRLALSKDRLTTIAQRHGVSYEDLTAPLARGFTIVMEARTATDWRNSKVDPAEYQKGSRPDCPTCKGSDAECPECDGTNKQRWERKEARLPGAAVKCGHCGHANPGHSDGAPCECGCTTFQPSSAKSGSRKMAWTHDPQRDGSGCTSCGSWAQVDSDNLCKDCSDKEDEREAASKTSSFLMPPGSVQVNHRPDKSGRYDVRQVWDPMSAYIVHQGYDIDKAHAAASKAVEDAKSKGCDRARLYPIPGYQGPDKTASKTAAVEQDSHASGFGDTRNQTTPYGQHPYPEGESEAGGDPNQKVENGWGSGMGTDIGKDAARTEPTIDDPNGYEYTPAPDHVQRLMQKRFEGGGNTGVHPTEPNTYLHGVGNWWDGPSTVKDNGDGSYSFTNPYTQSTDHFDEHGPYSKPEERGTEAHKPWSYYRDDHWSKESSRDPYSYLENHQCEDDGSGKCVTCAQDLPAWAQHKESSRDPYAQIHQALMDGQDPLEWVRQQNPAGSTETHHMTTEQFSGTNPVALTQAMEQAGIPGAPEIPGGHSETQEGVEQPAAEDKVSQGGTGAPEQPGGHRSHQGSRHPFA